MEGVGSTRLGRASARYGSTAVFNGPVRKWKKKWVHVSPSSAAKHSQSNGNGSAATSIVLCRWTPLAAADSGSSATASAVDGEDDEQAPKRKFRYTPVAVLEEERKRAAAKHVEDDAKSDETETNRSANWLSSMNDNGLNMNKDLQKETQDSVMGNLDLGLCLKGLNDSRSSGKREGQEKAASTAGFWAMG